MPANIIATSFSLIVFSTAIAVGVSAHNPAQTVMWRAMVAMIICWPIGLIIGTLAQKTIERNIENYKSAHPVPQGAGELEMASEDHAEVNVDIVEDM